VGAFGAELPGDDVTGLLVPASFPVEPPPSPKRDEKSPFDGPGDGADEDGCVAVDMDDELLMFGMDDNPPATTGLGMGAFVDTLMEGLKSKGNLVVDVVGVVVAEGVDGAAFSMSLKSVASFKKLVGDFVGRVVVDVSGGLVMVVPVPVDENSGVDGVRSIENAGVPPPEDLVKDAAVGEAAADSTLVLVWSTSSPRSSTGTVRSRGTPPTGVTLSWVMFILLTIVVDGEDGADWVCGDTLPPR